MFKSISPVLLNILIWLSNGGVCKLKEVVPCFLEENEAQGGDFWIFDFLTNVN